MSSEIDVGIVGAGPFGLSIAAHLGGRARVYGTPMEVWFTRMPSDMLLRSAWEETSLSAPDDAGTIDDWARAVAEPRCEPLPLATFLRYADWFRERFVADHDPHDVETVQLDGGGFRLTTTAGEETTAAQLVIAVGITPFLHAPPQLAEAVGERVSFAIDENDLARFAGKRVLIVGAGQSGLETAAVAARSGAKVEMIARSGVRWFGDREPHHPRGPLGRRLYRMAYPAVGYGPPPLNRLVLHPDAFAALPARLRHALTARLLRAGGSPWVRLQVEGKVTITQGVVPVSLEVGDDILLKLSDGSVREADHVLLATGYRFDLDRLTFLAPEVRTRIRTEGRWPVLDRNFRSSDARIFLVGYAAEGRFGPLSRFVLGCRFTARRVASAVGPDYAGSSS